MIRLFSMNDYLGLSTHPTVCKAVSDAALLMGSGTNPIRTKKDPVLFPKVWCLYSYVPMMLLQLHAP